VTETDQAVEAFVKEQVSSTYPDHQFIGEESHAAGEKHTLSDEPTFVHDLPTPDLHIV
jgi:myo-inositol-1(or 4)-monophosphatase